MPVGLLPPQIENISCLAGFPITILNITTSMCDSHTHTHTHTHNLCMYNFNNSLF